MQSAQCFAPTSEPIHISVAGIQLPQIRLCVHPCVKTPEPALWPNVLSVEAIPFLFVVATFSSFHAGHWVPAMVAVHIRDVCGVAGIARIPVHGPVHYIERCPHIVISQNGVRCDEGLQSSL